METALTVATAQARVLARFHRLPTEAVGLTAARGRTLAVDAVAAGDLPAFTNSAMDGYAVRARETTNASAATPVRLRVVGAIVAGDTPPAALVAGTAIAIATGAPVPAGADAVVRVEDTDGGDAEVTVRVAVAAGANVRVRGESVRHGATVMAAGTTLAAGQIAALAAVGVARVGVVRQPRIAILSTGNELVPVGTRPEPGQIWDVNGPLLAALVVAAGGVPISCGIARDTPDALREALDAVGDADGLITSGGVSVGTHDTVRAVLTRHGSIDFQRVQMRPGAPTTFGTFAGVPLLALPGNPVAAFVAFALLARPALARMLGRQPEMPPPIPARLTTAVRNDRDTPLVLRARIAVSARGVEADTAIDQAVGNIASLAMTDALVIVPPRGAIGAGDAAPALLLSALL